MHHESQHWANYSFFSVNNSNTTLLSGLLHYDKSDKDKAAKALDDLLESIKFK